MSLRIKISQLLVCQDTVTEEKNGFCGQINQFIASLDIKARKE